MTEEPSEKLHRENRLAENRLAEVGRLFLRLGFTAFGGPAAHIAMMRDEAVSRRKWLSDDQFLDLLGATNLIPGPNSTEMAIHTGYLRAGWRGLILAGAAFITPAMLMVMALAYLYVRFSELPQVEWLLYGIQPVVIVIVIQALLGLGQKAVKGPLTAVVGLAALAGYFLGLNLILILVLGGVAVMAVENGRRLTRLGSAAVLAAPGAAGLVRALAEKVPFSLPALFFSFLKIGSVLYGSGYVLLAFLENEFVTNLGWLTEQQIIDAVAIGQFTPGPVFTTATFIGYVLGGIPGALLATLGIFLPSFVFVALSNPLIPRVRNSPWAGALLDGVNVASLGLMAAVTFVLGRAALVDAVTVGIMLVAAGLIWRFRTNTTWLILGGAFAGWLRFALF